MKRILLAIAALVLAAGAQAAPFKNDELHLSIETPEKFTSTDQGQIPDIIGTQKARFLSPDFEKNSGVALIHHMVLPGAVDYAQFKAGLAEGLKTYLGQSVKIISQKDVRQGGWSGFMLEAEVPGDEKQPVAGGPIRHHLRWYLFRDGVDRLVGVAYDAREEAWKELEPAFTASIKTLKRTE